MSESLNSLSALYLQDPRLAAALRGRLMAEKLRAAGSDSSPVDSPWQGVARLIQGALGGYEEGQADKALDTLSQKNDDEAAGFSQRFRGAMTPSAVAGQPMQPSPMTQAVAGQPSGIHMAESGGSMQPGIYGDGGAAAGPMQVHAGALADVNKRLGTNYTHAQLASDPVVGKAVGDEYYKIQMENFGDPAKAAAAYNAGPGRVAAAVQAYGPDWQKGIPDATRAYVAKVTGAGQPAPGAPAAPGAPQLDQLRADLARAQNGMMVAQEGMDSRNPSIRRAAEGAMRVAQSQAENARAMLKFYEGAQPLSPERQRQAVEVATAGATRVAQDNRAYGEGAGEAYKLAANNMNTALQQVLSNKQTEQNLQLFEQAAQSFKPGATAELRAMGQKALAELGLPNDAAAANVMERIGGNLKLQLSQATMKGQGQVSDRERALLDQAADLVKVQPEALPVIVEAMRALHQHQNKIADIYLNSAEENGGTPNPVKVGRALMQLEPPLSAALVNKMQALVDGSASGRPAAVAPRALPTPAQAAEELARRRGAR